MATNNQDYLANHEKLLQLAGLQQRKASDPNYSVWVEASAGTGKTKVLSDRVLRLLLSGVRPTRILCLTYTKAAAVEMNDRITKRLSEWAVMEDSKLESGITELLCDELNSSADIEKYKKLARTLFAILLDTPGGLKIQTIHSFCEEILKRFPLEAGISPYFEIMDDSEENHALKQIQTELLHESRTQQNTAVAKALDYLVQKLNENTFPKLMQNITSNRVKIAETLNKYDSITDLLASLQKKLSVSDNKDEQILQAEYMRGVDLEKFRRNIICYLHGGSNERKKALAVEMFLTKEPQADDYLLYKNFYLNANGSLPQKFGTKASVQEDSDIVERMEKEAFRVFEFEKKLTKVRLYQSTKSILVLANAFIQQYENYKQYRAKLDYTDLIMLTRRLLSNPSVASWVLFKLDDKIDHILIDEAQDTSSEQWDIVKSLSEEFFAGQGRSNVNRTVFAVGDRKQSIFSFQGANPQKFDEMSNYFAHKAGTNFHKINLEVSFRSAPAVLESVNQLFANPYNAHGVVSGNEKVNHIPVRCGEFGQVELWPLIVADTDDKVKNDKDWLPPMEMQNRVSVRTKLAQKIAAKIKQLHDESQNTANPLSYRDFMVLVCRRNSFVEEFIRACKKADVSISGADKMVLTEQIAVQDLISLGKFLLLNNDDLSLAEVLKSPLFALTDNDLEDLCYNRHDIPLWVKLGDSPKFQNVYNQLKQLSDKIDYLRPYELFNMVLSTLDGRRKFIERMGVEVEDALDEFMNLTLTYEQKNIPNLQGFISWMGQNSIKISREGEQQEVDAVRLMTVHGSKGLQAPIVFLPDTTSLHLTKSEQSLFFTEQLAYYPLNKDYFDDICTQLKDERQQQEVEEYRRLLYVALTRAEDRLYICGCSNNAKINLNSWFNLCHNTLNTFAETDGETLIYQTPEFVAKKSKKHKINLSAEFQPESWINIPAPTEDLLSKPYTPSKTESDEEADSVSPLTQEGNFYRRGTLIHKILQFIPNTLYDREAIIDKFLQKNAADFPAYQQQQIKSEVIKLLNHPDFGFIFAEASHAEVPIIGEVEGKIISAQIDRLIVLPDKIVIVDFKTNRPAAADITQTPEVYINQLQTYAKLISKIYPNRKVESYILWTNETRLMKVA